MNELFGTYVVRRLTVLLMLVVVTGCVGRPPESPETRALIPTEAVSINEESTAATEAVSKRVKDRVTILALSGGGADGAYGVGVLNGWTKRGDRPKFDIVTGVSTGALMSVYAFLGPKYDALLKELYTTQEESDIYREKGPTGLLTDSLYDNTPLKEQIEKFITQEVIDKVAAEHAKGRRLYIATTNLDSSQLVVWDMGLLASNGGEGRADNLQLFQKVMRASSAIPVLFPPVYIKPKRGVQLRQAHVDGGVKAPVLISDFLFKQPARKRELYVIVNGSLALQNSFQAVRPNIRNIATMAVGGLTSELTHQVVYRGYVRAQNSGTKFQLTAIPDDVVPLDNALEFNKEHLKLLYDRGFKESQRRDFWWKSPPTIKKYDRVAAR
ncbi:MAG: patatin-like phospholipase family protein [Pseudomonadota bacterium]